MDLSISDVGTYDQGPNWACEEAFNGNGVGAGVHDGWAINKNLYAPGAFLFGSSNYIDSIRMDNGDGFKSTFPTQDVEGCNTKLHETYFELRDIEQDFLPRFREFYGSEAKRTCSSCGDVLPTDPRFVDV